MLNQPITFLTFLVIAPFLSLAQDKQNTTGKAIPVYSFKGDFNGDGKMDSGFVIAPLLDSEGMDCIGKCETIIRFSDRSIPDIIIDKCIGGEPVSVGDLNANGTDEIGMLKNWFTSCWSPYLVYTLVKNKWVLAVDPIITHCNQWDADVVPIEKDKTKKGYALIRYSASPGINDDNGSIEVKVKSVRVRS